MEGEAWVENQGKKCVLFDNGYANIVSFHLKWPVICVFCVLNRMKADPLVSCSLESSKDQNSFIVVALELTRNTVGMLIFIRLFLSFSLQLWNWSARFLIWNAQIGKWRTAFLVREFVCVFRCGGLLCFWQFQVFSKNTAEKLSFLKLASVCSSVKA